MMMFKFVFFISGLILFMNLLNVIAESKISSFIVKTSDCEHCGMGWYGSNLKLSICHKRTRDEPNLANILAGSNLREQEEECCYTNRFNKAYYPDFRQGLETEYKEDSILGKCFNFTFNHEKSIVKAHHEGADSLTLDWIDVRTDDNEKIRYVFSEPLSNNRYVGENLRLRNLEYKN